MSAQPTTNTRHIGKREKSPTKQRWSKDLYQSVTDKVIVELEEGCVPWVQPWGVDQATAIGLPTNGATGNHYSGINILLLWGTAIEGGHSCQTWLTFKQALSLGGNVKKGERGAMVVYADRFTPKDERSRAQETGEEARQVAFLKRYTVFNADQCENLPKELTTIPKLPECEVIPQAENVIAATGADFRIGGDKAFYAPSKDFIQVPPQPAFFDQINYYRTCFHELGHNAEVRIMPRRPSQAVAQLEVQSRMSA